ncbi:MAG: HAMP domain-containing histidine kinase [Halobacteriovoraceae bacterium]|nr:HAMP domain-containing histidine kinase [Halobacteriovoraceae bacterium]
MKKISEYSTLSVGLAIFTTLSITFCSLLLVTESENKKNIITQITSVVKRPLKSGDIRGTIYILESIRENNFELIELSYDNIKQISLPVSRRDRHARFGESRIVQDIYFENNQSSKVGEVVFIYSWLNSLKIGVYISVLLALFSAKIIRRYICKKADVKNKLEKEVLVAEIARQVAHDIRSPLAALDIAIKSIPDETKFERTIFNSAINRIHDLANDLLSKNKEPGDQEKQIEKISIARLLNLITSEKRLEYSKNMNLKIEFTILDGGYESFCVFSKKEFSRIISNLINNSVEASNDKQNDIIINISSDKENVTIEVSDTGKGIPNEYLDKIFIQGESIGKENGNGLGLSHAKSVVESFGGKINVISEIGKGTTITIRIPKIVPPESFVSQISLKRDSKIVLIEDDPSVHKAWESRFKREIKSFFTLESFKKWKVENDESGYIYIFDQEFKKESTNGLETILSMGIAKESILCTSHYENSEIQKTCEKSGIGLVDKSMIPYIPIIMEEDSKIRNLSILIDDDPLVRLVWKTRAKEQGIEFKCFSNEDDFYNELPNISKDSPIYIDSCLGDGVKGEDIARDLVTCGYEKVSIATGYEKEHFSDLPKQIKIQGKGSPW